MKGHAYVVRKGAYGGLTGRSILECTEEDVHRKNKEEWRKVAPLAYSAAKAALNSYVRGMCRVLGPQGVRINALSPGNVLFEGSSWESRLLNQPDTVREMLQREVAMQRLGNAQEIANVAAFLCSPKSSFLTGEVVVADGGQLRS